MNFHSRVVSELMHIDPIKCDSNMSVLNAAKLMTEKGHGSLVVVEKGRPTGIVTERDILSKLVAEDMPPSKTELSTIMTSPVITIHPEADITAAARAMLKNKDSRRLAVVSDDELMGILSDSDILGASTDLMATSEDIRNLVCQDTSGEFTNGYCEECKTYSGSLLSVNGVLRCSECRDGE